MAYSDRYYKNLYRQQQMPNVSLAMAGLTPATFNPLVYTPEKRDISILQRSLATLDARKEQSDIQRGKVAEAFAQARELLPDNEETNKYITDNQNRVINSIDQASAFGDFGASLEAGKHLAQDFMSSPEFSARVKEHKQRVDWSNQLDRLDVDNYIKEYYKDTYQDKNNFTYDESGNITGTKGWEAPLPEKSISVSDVIQQAVRDTSSEKTNVASTWSSEEGGGNRHITSDVLTADKISETAIAKVMGDPALKQNYIDQFNAGIHKITKLQKQLESITDEDSRERIKNEISAFESNFYVNDAPIQDADAYIKHLFSPDNKEIKNAAYDYRTSNIGSHTGSNGGDNGGRVGSGYGTDYGYDLGRGSRQLEPAPGQSVRIEEKPQTAPAKGSRSDFAS